MEDEILHLCEYYDFIKRELCYYTYKDFKENAEYIKWVFQSCTVHEKQLYKLYVYANTHMNLTCKNMIWEYLNGYRNFATL